MKIRLVSFLMILTCLVLISAKSNTNSLKDKKSDLVKDAVIYEVDLQKYPAKNKFAALVNDLPKLKKMGVNILCLLPINEIGYQNRMGKLGNPYAVRNHKIINPDYGTQVDFQKLIVETQKNGMKIIIDWVVAYTAKDHVWASRNKGFYKKQGSGNFETSNKNDQLYALDYENKNLRKEMQKAMQQYVLSFGIDGFRCVDTDVVPMDFWKDAMNAMNVLSEKFKNKPLIWIADSDDEKYHKKGFHLTQARTYNALLHSFVKGEKNVSDFRNYIENTASKAKIGQNLLYYTSNFQSGKLAGNENLIKSLTVLTYMMNGKILSGNCENNLDNGFKNKLLNFKNENEFLGNSGEIKNIPNTNGEQVLTFIRKKDDKKVFIILNLSNEKAKAKFEDTSEFEGTYTELMSSLPRIFTSKTKLKLEPWAIRVFVSK